LKITRRNALKMTALTAAATSTRSWSAPKPPPVSQPNILFIMCDQWRRHALGFMHQDNVSTPNLDRFAASNTVCTQAYSTVPVCSPNRSCLFSGKYSLHNGVLCNETTLMPDRLALGDFCKAAGYQTAYMGKWHMGFRQVAGSDKSYTPPEIRHGFDHWFVEQDHQPFDQPFYIGDAKVRIRHDGWEPELLADHAIQYMEKRDTSKPFCAVVSFGPPHTGGGAGFEGRFIPGKEFKPNGKPSNYGYSAPAEVEALYTTGGKCYQRPVRKNVPDIPDLERSKAIQGYFGALTSIDAQIGRILAAVDKNGLGDNTVIVFLSDHGDFMGSHGRFGKDWYLQESCAIPMIFRYPGQKGPGRYEGVFASIDVLPTLLGLASVPSHGLDGVDHSTYFRTGKGKQPEGVHLSFFMGGYGEAHRQYRTLITTRYTYALNHGIHAKEYGPEVLFDRDADPLEMKPIYRGKGQDALMDSFKDQVVAHLDQLQDPYMATMWAGGPRAANPDPSFYDAIIANARFPEQRSGISRKAEAAGDS
jgi:arylsulfatase A-like enzyme